MRLVNVSRNVVLAERVRPALNFFSRLVGLMGKRLSPGEALWLRPCRSVHTCFLPSPIDIIFVSRTWRVVGLRCTLPPWRVAACRGSTQAIELPPGTVERTGMKVGDELKLC